MFCCLDNKHDKAKKETRKKEYFQLILGIDKHSQLLNQRITVTLPSLIYYENLKECDR